MERNLRRITVSFIARFFLAARYTRDVSQLASRSGVYHTDLAISAFLNFAVCTHLLVARKAAGWIKARKTVGPPDFLTGIA